MSQEPFFGNWMVAIAEALEVAGSTDLETATGLQLKKAWDLVASAADISVEELAGKVAEEAGLDLADFEAAEPHAPMLLPAELAWRRLVVPLRATDRDMVVATSDSLSHEAKREVALVSGRDVTLEITTPGELDRVLMEAYGDMPTGVTPIAPPDRVKPGGPHVLVVDDEAGARALVRSVLEEAGFRVTVSTDGPQAIELLSENHDFDLITLDYWMDQMNGLRVLQHIRALPGTRDVPVIVVTGAGDRRIAMSLFEAGADDFIDKPIDAPLFLLRIQAVIRRRRMR